MASCEEANPFTCNICLDDKVQKSPKILHCHHSFCEACLKTWHTKRHLEGLDTKNKVECPVCRKKTNLPQGGITALPHDFRVKEFSTYLNTKPNTPLCQACSQDGPTYKAKLVCRTCNRRFCETCGEGHKKVPLFSQHQISAAVCELHFGVLEFVCVTCVSGICVECVYSKSHEDHEILAAEEGLSKIKAVILNIKSELKDTICAYDTDIKDKLQACLDMKCKSDDKLRHAGELIKTTINDIVQESIENHKRQHTDAIDSAFGKLKEEDEIAASLIKGIENLFETDTEEALVNLGKLSSSGKEYIDSTKILHRSLPEPSLLSPDCCRLQGIEKVFDALAECKFVCGIASALAPSCESPTPVLQKKVECGPGTSIVAPWNANITPDGGVIVCCFHGGAVNKVHLSGEIEELYNDHPIVSSCVSDDAVFLLFKDGTNIVKLSPERSPKLFPLTKREDDTRGIIVEGSLVYILYRSGILRHSLSDDVDEWVVLVGNFESFTRIRMGDSKMLSVVDSDADQVVMFNDFGEEIFRLGNKGSADVQLEGPMAVKRMSNGNLLVSEWETSNLAEYTPDGKFVRNLLTASNGLDHPSGVAVHYPYIWVTESVKNRHAGKRRQSVKLFKYPP